MPPQMPHTRTVLRWSAYEHEHIERTSDWFWALGIAAICVAVVCAIFHDILFGVLIVVAAIAIALLARIAPEPVQFEISERGVRIGPILHRYHDIISFWVEEEREGHPVLLIDTKKIMSPNIIIPIQHIDPSLVRGYLKQHAKEMPMHEPFAHKVLEFIGL